MTNMPATQKDRIVARPPNVLVPLIKEDLRQEREAGMPHKIAAGTKMIEASATLKGQDLYNWTQRHFELGTTQTKIYINLAKASGYGVDAVAPTTKSFKNLDDFQRQHLGRNRPTSGRVLREWTQPVDDIADRARKEAQRIRDAELTRVQEREAERQLALRLIDIGYKVLAKELHPDKGGSRDAMTRLTTVRDRLKAHA
jgi:hypothetical protein